LKKISAFSTGEKAFSPGENGLIYFRFGENAYLHSMFSKSKTTTNLWARVKNEVI
jgi:hypothetical protein